MHFLGYHGEVNPSHSLQVGVDDGVQLLLCNYSQLVSVPLEVFIEVGESKIAAFLLVHVSLSLDIKHGSITLDEAMINKGCLQ
jgi:hypothetical protein